MTIVKTLVMVSSVVNLGNPMPLTVSSNVISRGKVFKKAYLRNLSMDMVFKRGIGGVIYGSINLGLLCDQ